MNYAKLQDDFERNSNNFGDKIETGGMFHLSYFDNSKFS